MKLTNFEQWIDDKILERGLAYFTKGKVLNLSTTDGLHYKAKVDGTDVYQVDIFLNQDVIVNSYCDCPYDLSEYCKHQAAVLFALRNGKPANEAVSTTEPGENSPIKIKPANVKDIKSVLLNQSKEALISLILELMDEYPDMEKRVLFKYAPNKDEISAAKKLVQEYITSAKRKGFIDWRHIDHALQGADMTLQKAREKMEMGDIESTVLLSLAVLTPVVKMLNFSDDSNGSVGTVMNWAIGIIDDAVTASITYLNDKEKKKLFEAIMKEALKEQYDGWSDWRSSLLRICTCFSSQKDLREKLEKHLESLLKKEGSSWGAKYDKTQVKLLQLEIIERCDGTDAAEKFIFSNLHYSEFRKKAIEIYLKQEKYEKAIELCLEGEKADKDYRGLIKEWRDFRYQAYEMLGDIEQQRSLAKELLFQNDFKYYLKLKELYSPNEWEGLLKKLVDEFGMQKYQPSAYLSILLEENLTPQLLKYCQGHISTITEYYPYLLKDYLEEVNSLFIKYINHAAEEATDRKKYRKVCTLIKTYKTACGTIQSHKLITELREKYPRRPAFIEELGKIR